MLYFIFAWGGGAPALFTENAQKCIEHAMQIENRKTEHPQQDKTKSDL
jgi:hypothetical protein